MSDDIFGTGAAAPVEDQIAPPMEGMPAPEDLHAQALDDELAVAIDEEQLKKNKRDSQLARGWYRTSPPLFMNGPEPDEEYAAGRILARYNGTVEGIDTKNVGRKGRVTFRLSHQRRDKERQPGVPDMATQLFGQAAEAYKALLGRVPTVREVYHWVAQFPVELLVIPGDRSEIVLGLRAPKV